MGAASPYSAGTHVVVQKSQPTAWVQKVMVPENVIHARFTGRTWDVAVVLIATFATSATKVRKSGDRRRSELYGVALTAFAKPLPRRTTRLIESRTGPAQEWPKLAQTAERTNDLSVVRAQKSRGGDTRFRVPSREEFRGPQMVSICCEFTVAH
eukprot:s120_g7.t1